MTVVDDARAIVTGFGSVRVVAGTVDTRGLFDDAEADAVTPGGDAVVRVRVLTLVGADVPDLAREDTISIGTLTDDQNLTGYRVVDIQRLADGILWRVPVAA